MTTAKTTVAGVTFENRQGKLHNMRRARAHKYLTLRRDANNGHDANAIAVIGHIYGGAHAQIGYLPAKLAEKLAPKMDAGEKVSVKGFKIHGGTEEKPTLGGLMELSWA